MSLVDPAPLLDRYATALLRAMALPAPAPRHARLAAALGRHAQDAAGTPQAERAALLQTAPGLAPHLALLEACAAALPDVLAGRVVATDVLFPGGATHLVEGLYRQNPWADRFNNVLARATARAAAAGGLRVMEVGAGTGGASAAVLAALDGVPGQVARYLYTDVSPGFLAHSRAHFGAGRPWLDFRRFDLEAEPEAQGFAPGDCDVLIASNVVHATRRIADSLARLRRLLRPGGLLLLNELTRAGAFASMTFGLLDGWWAFEDAEARLPDAPLLSLQQWRAALAQAGFGAPGAVGLGADPENSFQCVLVAEAVGQAAAPAATDVETKLTALLATALGLAPQEIARDRPFGEYGVDSIVAPQLAAAANAALGCDLAPTDIFGHATLAALARHVVASTRAPVSAPHAEPAANPRDIAVIGLSCRFPGAPNADAFWDLLREGRSAIRPVPPERFALSAKLPAAWGGFLDEHDAFDPEIFNMTWREAAAMSPQQRVFLEAAWHALEDAGYGARALDGLSCGVFCGVAHREHGSTEGGESLPALGNSVAILTARISYLLNLRGPSLPVDTACSSSLVAIHLACQSLLSGDAEMALAGGVSVLLTDDRLHLFLRDAGMASPTGACRAFDAGADGFVPGEGVGVVVLKPLAKALAAGDRVLGVIRGSGINQDGRTSGITAPSGPAQTALQRAVWERAGIAPQSIGLVEAHGTGTPLGDPIEWRALAAAFGTGAPAGGTAIGSVKTNIGHALTAAGVAGFIKALLALRHETIPPSLHFGTPNPQLPLAGAPFRVPVAAEPWPCRAGQPRRATVSSFGFSGTNAHLVLEEAPALPATQASGGDLAFLLSARTAEALAARVADLRRWIASNPDAAPRDLAFTLAAGRSHFAHRLAVVARDLAGLEAALARPEPVEAETSAAAEAALAALPASTAAQQVAALYRQGADGDWARLFPGPLPRRLGLPGYPFVRLRFDAQGVVQAPLLLSLDPAGWPMADHLLHGRPLLPAASILDLALRAAPGQSVGDLRLLAPAFAAAGQAARLETRGEGFALIGPDGVLHAQFRAVPALPLPAGETPGGIASRLGPVQQGAALYTRFAETGFVYGPGLRAIQSLQSAGEEVLAWLAVPQAAPAGEYLAHPALLDGAMQAAIGLAGDGALPEGVVPMGLGRLTLTRRLPAACWAHIRRRPASEAGVQRLDIALLDEQGAVLAQLEDLALRLRQAEPAPNFAVPVRCPVASAPQPEPDLVLGDVALWEALGRRPRLVTQAEVSGGWPALLAGLPAPPACIWHHADGEAGFFSLAALARALLATPGDTPCALLHLHDGSPEGAMAGGLAQALAKESGRLRLGSLAVPPDGTPADWVPRALALPLAPGLALDGTARGWAFVPGEGATRLRRGGVYVLAGGAGGIGQLLARHLVQRWQAKVIVLGRSRRDAVPDDALLHLQVDLTDADAVASALELARQRFGPIQGVVQAAGVQRDGLFRNLAEADLRAVLAPKLAGTRALDAATRQDPLHFFALFSSLAGSFGAAGQAGYAAANAFLDAFAAQRQGPGVSLSIAWPYWAAGGMSVAEGEAEARASATGIAPLGSAAGLAAFETALGMDHPHLLVLPGDRAAIARFIQAEPQEAAVPARVVDATASTLDLVTAIFAEAAGMPPDRLRPDRAFEDYGIDSILVTKLTAKLEQALGTKLPATLLFDHRTLRSLAAALPSREVVQPTLQSAPEPATRPQDIAIIGMAGRFPDSDTLEEFWQNLRAGREVIRDIPPERWDAVRSGGATRGGFLRQVDRFDPLSFGISPAEAARMDPQERLFLETCWEAMEDAGHTRASLAGPARQGGVFVGVMYGDYALRVADQHAQGNPVSGAAPYWSIANRVSYALDLRGPSLALDTACSASLTAIHLACRALIDGDCAVAIAGGVNLALHPLKFVGLQEGRFASSDGRCRSFAEGGDGYVPSEGVGAVILKPLAQALADGDAIHAVIRGSAVAHGGRTNGYTVPSPARQAEVIGTAMGRAGVQPAEISLVEAHGTGTALGDPVEVAGLSAAYGEGVVRGSVALGSIKATMGHMEAAAGVAGLLKLVLQMRHRWLPPMPRFGGPNRKIDFARSPFRLQHDGAPWTGTAPLRAGLSGFGAGGSNAHLVVEEAPIRAALPMREGPALLVLSARTLPQLRATAARLASALPGCGHALADIAATLQWGREALPVRLAFVAAEVAEAAARFAAFAAGDASGLHHGVAEEDAPPPPPVPPGATLETLARGFVAGAEITWPAPLLRRVPLPPRAFLGERHWIEKAGASRLWRREDALVRDHVVAGRHLLPGAALLQMALEAAPEAATLTDITWLRRADVPEAGLALRLRREGEGFVVADEAGPLVRGRIGGTVAVEVAGPDSVAQRLDAAAISARLRALGLEYGPSLSLLDSVETDGTAIRARIRAPDNLAALVDTAFQALIGLAPAGEAPALRIPFALAGLQRLGDVTQARQVVGRRRGDLAEGLFDIAALDAAGAPLLRLCGLATRPAPVTATSPAPATATSPALPVVTPDLAASTFRPVWRAVAAPGPVEIPLLLAGCDAVPAALAHLPRLGADGVPQGARLVWLAPATAQDPAAPALALLATLQALDRAGRLRQPLGLTVLAAADTPVAASLFGLAKCAALEWPMLSVALLRADAAALAAPDLAARLAAEPGQAPAREVAWQGTARRQLVLEEVPLAEAPLPPGAVWLVVGGTGGIGLALAERLAQHPEARIALVGRSAPSQPLGPQIRHFAADATDEAALRRLLPELRAAWGRPVDYAVQAALVLRDGALARMTEADFRAAFAPRAEATLALEAALAAEPVPPRAVILFSSANALPGAAGQANYVAGSSFAAAALRQGEAPWRRLVIHWGLWGQVGAVADAATQARLARLGVHPILPADGMAQLGAILGGEADAVVAVKAEASALAQLGVVPAEAGDADLAPSVAAFAALERWGRLRLRAVLDGMGLPGAATPAGLARRLGIAPRHATLFAALLELLARDGLARNDDGLWRFPPAPEAGATPEGPGLAGPLALLQAVLDRYPALLRGEVDPVEVLFPGAETALVEGAYAGNPVADRLNTLLAQAVATARPLRVLEIGAGSGATTAALWPLLREAGAEYWFTDVSRHFLTRAEARFPGIRTALYDAERSPAENGVPQGGFDAVIATNVLHATQNLPATLKRLAPLLRQGGLLAVNEVTRPQDFATIVFGLTEGWWRGAAEPGRLPGTPLADAARWQALFRDAGFSDVTALTPEEGGQSLILGRLAQAAVPIAVPAPATAAPVTEAAPTILPPRLVALLRGHFAAVLRLPAEEMRLHQPFDGWGLESLTALDIRNRIAADFPDVPATLLFEQNTLARLATHLLEAHPAQAAAFLDEAPAAPLPAPAPRVQGTSDAIAIIGFSGRFPGGEDPQEFWQLIESGGSAIAPVPAARGGAEGAPRWAGLIEGVDLFDPLFFGLSPLEAEAMDPQERLFLETAWATLEAAGTTPARLARQAGGAVGVFVGVMNTGYQWHAAQAWAAGQAQAGASHFWSIANRVSHLLDLGGPSMAVDTACSSSLTAIHLACESLRRGECGAAIAGGVNLILHPRQMANLAAAGMLASGGACRAFGAGADGFVDGEGVGAVLLKPLAAARRDGDRIEGVILGSAINSGGRTAGFTVPNPQAQARAIRAALAQAGVPAESIAVVEAHGTGTALGDPIEVAGLLEGYGRARRQVALGALKANIGHLESAAGIAGLTKLLLQLRHGRIAPHPQAATPNPLIDFAATPFRLPATAQDWPRVPGAPRRAGLSSFGAGGANAHLILEEAPAAPQLQAAPLAELVPLSAVDEPALRDLAQRLLAALDRVPDLAAVAHTLRVGRMAQAVRAVLLVRDLEGLRGGLRAVAAGAAAQGLTRGGTASATARMLAETTEGQALLRGLLKARDLPALAGLWVEGAEIDWQGLTPDPPPTPLDLPGTAFARQRIWLPEAAAPQNSTALHLLARGWQEVKLPEARSSAGLLLVLTADAALAAALGAAWPGPNLVAESEEAALRQIARLDPQGALPPLVVVDALPAEALLPRCLALLRAAQRGGLAHRLRLLRLHRQEAPAMEAACAALLRSALLEAPDGAVASIAVEGEADAAQLGAICRIEGTAETTAPEVFWRSGRRFLPVLAPRPMADAPSPFRAGGAYLLVGGLGEVGRALAVQAARAGARIGLLGRRPEAEVAPLLAELRVEGVELAYAGCDLTDAAALEQALAALRARLGAFQGVLQLARAVEDGPLAEKDAAGLQRVLAPKLEGTLALDAAMAEEPLDWFILCGSLAGWFGLAGGADYAAACAWQGAFAEARQAQVLRGERQGRTVAVAWPQWAYDRHATPARLAALARQAMAPLTARDGIALLGRALAADGPAQLAAVKAEAAGLARIVEAYRAAADAAALPPGEAIAAELAALSEAELASYIAHLRGAAPARPEPAVVVPLPVPAPAPPMDDTEAALRAVLSAYLKIPAERLGAEVAFATIGLDSIRALQAAERLGRRFGLALDPTVFFEHPTIGDLARALAARLAPARLEAGE
ncbi:SDR family NAD(P)-dependent oxidoreductase [Falsiroseomonas tokyonensis]|uniref:SDR family NAD(P)-dependent oxidoreductase n=1 Tax=Falsiroseomonas tokyonensis TaxID=430521 RepID=A0ABV7BME7_9PROT|nr:SDR family NAD(P)-dependent oxidoreductase [Falsiroseomonas tokyonensis]MBU8536763.1 SDR family NAD(P)-dependent oxidoreductase [Falsiroseomonas tokyonensis]